MSIDPKERERQLTAEILERVRELARLREGAEPAFVPGKSPVRYAGRVYGAPELTNLVESGLEFWLTAGRWHRRLEERLAEWYGVEHARLVNSGSSANLLAVAALRSHLLGERRLRAGDEIITVAAGFPTTVAPALQLGLVPVFVDVSLPGYNLDVSQLEAARSPRTRAVMVAHTLGNPFDLAAVKAFCERHRLWLVEDNCDAAGSLYHGRKTGTFGDLATLSFYPPHHMTMGEGGAVLTSDDTLKRAVESLRDWGRDCWCNPGVDNTCRRRFEWQLGELPRGYDHKYVYGHLGFNLKVTDMQAAVGLAQLERLAGFVEARRRNWAFYREALGDLSDALVLPEPTPGSEPSWFGFMMTVREGAAVTRDALVRHLEGRKIQTRMLFAGNLVRQPALTQLVQDARDEGRPPPFRVVGELVNTDAIMNRSLWVGVYPGLTEAMRAYVAESIRDGVRGAR
ncbi:lipopolysaccharide biosynthesis protein RfbH [Anaeromyxobacter dehalogenans]|uniref:DegT/DnrJ/EryC1/StrS aminotransferase n=1 Tax=Anaeromyxobacter dehalogenans (strain 2CP-C) TaxID=290397 RepID=Q2IHJ8_ANADE|nr:lipopolysaccharide biosynthesis protein RfbH [Anaeromyxobacter dehalogenans]ABC84059.1 DegT/DnrJ/EryC1/StrS aminotransferase [Anaeromyxobacter dehalogenans 2CP-C]